VEPLEQETGDIFRLVLFTCFNRHTETLRARFYEKVAIDLYLAVSHWQQANGLNRAGLNTRVHKHTMAISTYAGDDEDTSEDRESIKSHVTLKHDNDKHDRAARCTPTNPPSSTTEPN